MLARHRIVFPEGKLFRHAAGVFLGDVKETRVRGAQQFDLDAARLSHNFSSGILQDGKQSGKILKGALKSSLTALDGQFI